MIDKVHRSRRRQSLVLGAAVLALAFALPAHAASDGSALPGACEPNLSRLVAPGCPTALTRNLRDPGVTLPNLVPNVEEVFMQGTWVYDPALQTVVQTGPWTLFFDSHAQNLGTVPLQLTFSGVENADTTTASQCVSWTDRVCRDQVPVGGFSWHMEHAHFHYNEFGDYQLRRLGADGRPDYSDAGLIARSEKVSFCLMDSKRVREDAAPAQFYVTCTPTVEGISPGWTDIYTPDLEGQQFPADDLVPGRYALVVSLDYGNAIHETDDTDNVVEVTIEVAGRGQVAIVDRHYP